MSHVEINSVDPVGLTGASLSGDDSNEERDDLGGELHRRGQETGLLLGSGSQLSVLNGVVDLLRCRTKLPGKLISIVPGSWQHSTLVLLTIKCFVTSANFCSANCIPE